MNKTPNSKNFDEQSYLTLNENENKKLITLPKYKKQKKNEEYYDNLLEKLKKENEGTNISTTLKTKHVKNKFSNIERMTFNKNQNNIHLIIDRVFDNEKQNEKEKENDKYESKKIKIYLINSEPPKIIRKKNNQLKKKNKSFIQNEENIINKNIKNIEDNHKNYSKNKIFQCLLCCCPTS